MPLAGEVQNKVKDSQTVHLGLDRARAPTVTRSPMVRLWILQSHVCRIGSRQSRVRTFGSQSEATYGGSPLVFEGRLAELRSLVPAGLSRHDPPFRSVQSVQSVRREGGLSVRLAAPRALISITPERLSRQPADTWIGHARLEAVPRRGGASAASREGLARLMSRLMSIKRRQRTGAS